MAEGRTSDDVERSGQASSDRLWILVNAGRGDAAAARPGGRTPRQTVIVRDGDHLLISVDVGSGSALAVPFKAAELGSSEATLIVRLVSGETPCAACIDERLARAAEELGGLGAEDVFRAVRAAIAGCAGRAHDGPPSAAGAGGPGPESARPRSAGSLLLAPANAPCVPAAGVLPAESDIDVILII